MAYIDIKHTVWERYEIEDIHIEEFMKLNEKERHQEVLNSLLDNSTDIKFLHDTSEYITPAENSNAPTIEIYYGKSVAFGSLQRIWDNTPIELKRDEKITKLIDFTKE